MFVLDRDTLAIVSAIGGGGRWPGRSSASAASPSIPAATFTRARTSRASASRSSHTMIDEAAKPYGVTRDRLIGAGCRRRSSARPARHVLQQAADAQDRSGAAGAAVRGRSRCGRSRCRTTGFSARRSAWRSTRRITSGSCIATTCSAPTKRPRIRARRSRRAAPRRRRCSSSIPPVISWAIGVGPPPATIGRSRITASSSITRTTSGSAATSRNDAHVLKFTQHGQVHRRSSGKGQNKGSNDTGEFRPGRQDLRRCENQ